MQQGLNEQVVYLCIVFLNGILSGFLYDILRAKRKVFKVSKTGIIIEDILFCVICGGISLYFTFHFNSGEIRAGAFFCIGLGFMLYYLIIRNKALNVLVKAILIIKKLIRFLLKTVLFPVKIIVRLFRKPACVIVWYAGGKYKRLRSIFRVNINKLKKRAYICNLFIKKR